MGTEMEDTPQENPQAGRPWIFSEIKLAFWKKSMVDFLSWHFGCLIRIMGSQVTGGLEIQKKTCEKHIQTPQIRRVTRDS